MKIEKRLFKFLNSQIVGKYEKTIELSNIQFMFLIIHSKIEVEATMEK
jgi:hypothetical protein